MKDIIALTYNEIEDDLLEKTLENDGMIFIRLSARRAKNFIKLYERGVTIEKYKWNRPGWAKRQIDFILVLASIVKVFFFHMKLIELDAFKTVKELRCTWEIQSDGEYILIFS